MFEYLHGSALISLLLDPIESLINHPNVITVDSRSVHTTLRSTSCMLLSPDRSKTVGWDSRLWIIPVLSLLSAGSSRGLLYTYITATMDRGRGPSSSIQSVDGRRIGRLALFFFLFILALSILSGWIRFVGIFDSGKMAMFQRLLGKLAVENEPGLSTSQLMLVNRDLQPGRLMVTCSSDFSLNGSKTLNWLCSY